MIEIEIEKHSDFHESYHGTNKHHILNSFGLKIFSFTNALSGS